MVSAAAARLALLLSAVLLGVAPADAAEWQVRPFIGLTFAGSTTFVDFEDAAGSPNVVFGASGVWQGEIVGVDVDVGHAPGFFQRGDRHLVVDSSVTTVTGNIVVSLPRRLTEYTLRPYVVGGAGVMHVNIDDALGALRISNSLAAIDFGGGAVGFVTRQVGIAWEIRRFRSFSENRELRGRSVAPEQLSFWRATMAIAIRY